MAAAPYQDEDEAPLDPALLRVQSRMRAMIWIAGLTLGLGLLAVLFAIVYRIVTLDDSGAEPLAEGADPAALAEIPREALGLPADARLVSTALDGNRIALTYEGSGGTYVVILDIRGMGVVSRARIAE